VREAYRPSCELTIVTGVLVSRATERQTIQPITIFHKKHGGCLEVFLLHVSLKLISPPLISFVEMRGCPFDSCTNVTWSLRINFSTPYFFRRNAGMSKPSFSLGAVNASSSNSSNGVFSLDEDRFRSEGG